MAVKSRQLFPLCRLHLCSIQSQSTALQFELVRSFSVRNSLAQDHNTSGQLVTAWATQIHCTTFFLPLELLKSKWRPFYQSKPASSAGAPQGDLLNRGTDGLFSLNKGYSATLFYFQATSCDHLYLLHFFLHQWSLLNISPSFCCIFPDLWWVWVINKL